MTGVFLAIVSFLYCIGQDLHQVGGSLSLIGPTNSSVLVNSSTRLTCRVLGSSVENAEVQWIKDGFGYQNMSMQKTFKGRYNILGPFDSGNHDLLISNIELEDDGVYACQAQLSLGSVGRSPLVTTNSAELKVVVPPSSIRINQYGMSPPGVPLTEVWGPVGHDVLLYCTIEAARPASRLAWFLNGERIISEFPNQITDWTKPTETESNLNRTRSVLRLRLSMTQQSKTLECAVDNWHVYLGAPTIKTRVKINIQYIRNVVVRSHPSGKGPEYREEEAVNFMCQAESSPSTVTYSWSIISALHGQEKVIVSNSSQPHLSLLIKRGMHLSRIRCTVQSTLDALCRNSVFQGGKKPKSDWYVGPMTSPPDHPSTLGEFVSNSESENCTEKYTVSAKQEEELFVTYAPVILDTVQTTLSASLNQLVSLKCLVDSNPPAVVAWYRGTPRTGQVLIATSANHMVRVTSQAVFGLYTCVARSPGFPDASKLVYLGQAGPPTIISKENVYARRGQPIKIHCTVRAIPQPRREDVRWLMADGTLINNPRFHIYQEDFMEGVTSIIYIAKVEAKDFAPYNCSATNDFGHYWKIITLCAADEAPLAFAVGSAVAVVFALSFSFIIVCIVKKGQSQRRPKFYVKAEDYPGLELPNGTSDMVDPAALNAPYSNEEFLEQRDVLWKDPMNSMYRSGQLERKVFDRCSTLRKLDWKDDAIYQDNANGSTRSADSGVCPDEAVPPTSNGTPGCTHPGQYSLVTYSVSACPHHYPGGGGTLVKQHQQLTPSVVVGGCSPGNGGTSTSTLRSFHNTLSPDFKQIRQSLSSAGVAATNV